VSKDLTREVEMTKETQELEEKQDEVVMDLEQAEDEFSSLVHELQAAQEKVAKWLPQFIGNLKKNLERGERLLKQAEDLQAQLPEVGAPKHVSIPRVASNKKTKTVTQGELGEFLKSLRTGRNWTQRYAAQKAGISASVLCHLENGATPSSEQLEGLAKAYKIPVENFPVRAPN
jgi:DNA-binding XRE family transcriptional regulator